MNFARIAVATERRAFVSLMMAFYASWADIDDVFSIVPIARLSVSYAFSRSILTIYRRHAFYFRYFFRYTPEVPLQVSLCMLLASIDTKELILALKLLSMMGFK